MNRTKFLTNYMAMAMRTSKHRVRSIKDWYWKKFQDANDAFEQIDKQDSEQYMDSTYQSR